MVLSLVQMSGTGVTWDRIMSMKFNNHYKKPIAVTDKPNFCWSENKHLTDAQIKAHNNQPLVVVRRKK